MNASCDITSLTSARGEGRQRGWSGREERREGKRNQEGNIRKDCGLWTTGGEFLRLAVDSKRCAKSFPLNPLAQVDSGRGGVEKPPAVAWVAMLIWVFSSGNKRSRRSGQEVKSWNSRFSREATLLWDSPEIYLGVRCTLNSITWRKGGSRRLSPAFPGRPSARRSWSDSVLEVGSEDLFSERAHVIFAFRSPTWISKLFTCSFKHESERNQHIYIFILHI